MGEDLYIAQSVVVGLHVASQKQLFQELAGLIIEANGLDIEARGVVAAAVERERLGSTGV